MWRFGWLLVGSLQVKFGDNQIQQSNGYPENKPLSLRYAGAHISLSNSNDTRVVYPKVDVVHKDVCHRRDRSVV